MKKTLALVLALAMVFSTITVAFAEDTLGADAQACANLGMLKGETGTVDAAYTATAPTRLQAAIMFLRLKGLEAEALAFTGTDNFADAKDVNWAGGKAIMAYLKANPQLGWQGNAGNLTPNNKITAQEYYKVMLEALGYKQTTPEVVGDFAWADVFTFAASVGLSKVATVTNFTVNDVATATVEALKLNVKGGTKTLATTLVEAGKMDKAAAVAADLYKDVATTEAKLDAVIASANDKVEVTFDGDVAVAFAENAANYKVVVKGSTTALEVKSAKAISSTVVELTTAAQTGGTAYTMTVGDVSKNFAGIAKESGVPEIDTVTCIDTNTVEVVFKKAMDRASAEDVANYTLNNGATVVKAELWVDQDDSRKTVKLTTEGVVKSKVYKLKVANVKSADQVAIKTVEKSFAGVTDTTAPKINGNVIVKNNQRILVNFTDAHGVDKASVEDLANVTIDGLAITSIKVVDFDEDHYGYWDQVEINTEPMDASKKYTITFNNLADGSVSKNVVSKSVTKSFYGVSVDKTAPKAGTITVIGDNMLEIAFTETNRLDVATATDINNYSFTEGLTVLSVKMLKASKPDETSGKTVVLTTSTMDKDTTYKISIENVADEFGNVMTKLSNRTLARSTGADNRPPYVTKVAWIDDETVRVYFNERLDIDAANDPANYSISGGIGTVKEAAISSLESNPAGPYTRVTLTTAKMSKNTKYTLTINGVKDRLDNVMSSYKVTFVAGTTEPDTDRPEIDTITAENKDLVKVTFNEALTVANTAAIGIDTDNNGSADVVGSIVGLNTPATNTYDYAYTTDEGTSVNFLLTSSLATTGEIKIVSLTGVKDRSGNTYVVDTTDYPTFYGSQAANDVADIDTVDQVDAKTIKITFNEPVMIKNGVNFRMYEAALVKDSANTTYKAYIDKGKDGDQEGQTTLTLVRATNFSYNTKYTFDLNDWIVDYNKVFVNNQNSTNATEYTTLLDDKEKPVIDYVEPINEKLIHVVFNESMDTAGSYEVQKSDGTKVTGVSTSAVVNDDDDTIVDVTLTFTNQLEAGEVYKLAVKTAAKDIAGNPVENISDLSFDFVQSAVAVSNWIAGVKLNNAREIKVYTTNDMAVGVVVAVYRRNAANNTDVREVGKATVSTAGTTLVVTLKESMIDGVSYRVSVKQAGSELYSYTYTGVSSDGGITIDTANDVVTFSGWDALAYAMMVVYDGNADGVIAATEEFFVYPTYNVTDAVYQFDLTTLYQTSDGTTTAALAGITTGSQYTVEVYRLLSDISASTMSGLANAAAYQGVVWPNNAESQILYSRTIEKGNE